MSRRRSSYKKGRRAGLDKNLKFSMIMREAGGIRKHPGVRLTLRKGLFRLLLVGNLEVEIQTRESFSSSMLKSKRSKGLQGAGLVPQLSYHPIPLADQSLLPLKVSTQCTALLRQALCGAVNLGSLTAAWSNSTALMHTSSLTACNSSLTTRSSPSVTRQLLRCTSGRIYVSQHPQSSFVAELAGQPS